jgi:hypothetical protein
METDWRRLREKLRDAADAVKRDDGRPLQDRLRSAYLYGLSGLRPEDFPDEEGCVAFNQIKASLTATGEMFDEAGTVPSTTFAMNDTEAARVGAAIIALADQYDAY